MRALSHWAALLDLVLVCGSSFALTGIAVESVAPAWVRAGRVVLAAAILPTALATLVLFWLLARIGSRFVASRRISAGRLHMPFGGSIGAMHKSALCIAARASFLRKGTEEEMTTITHAVSAQGAQVRDALVRIVRRAGEILAMLDAAIRVSSAIERRQSPNPADLKLLGVQATPLRFY